jgi:hypothetical protein
MAQVEQQRMAEEERLMNEAKLKMLIKFDRIKHLEDYYNVMITRLYLISCTTLIDRNALRLRSLRRKC